MLEIVVIGLIVLLLFGHRLPGLARSMGLGITEFKRGLNGDDSPEPGALKPVERASKPRV